jgi:glycogen debranching enzyme
VKYKTQNVKREYLFSAGLILLLVLATGGCASKAKQQAQIRRAYAAGEQAAHAQMEQAAQQQQQLAVDSQVRILGHVRNPLLNWEPGLTLARALVEADYENGKTPTAITIYRNNQQLNIDLQRLLEGEDYPLFAGDIVYIQD